MLIRRVVPAIVATLVAYTGLALLAGNYLREHYLAPLLTTNLNVPSLAFVLSQRGQSQVLELEGRSPPTSSRHALGSRRGLATSRR